jgi:sugar phosphate isomerase/epimerase
MRYDTINRRDFLKTAGTAAAVPMLGNALAHADSSSTNSPRLLVGCCALSYKKYFDAGSMKMEDFFKKAVELGVNGVDVTSYWLRSTDPEYLTGLRHLAFQSCLPFSGVAIRTEMCQSDAAKRAEEVRNIQKWVDATQWLGASHLRVFGGNLPKGASEKQGIDWVAEVMKAASDYSGKRGITLGIESHGGITGRAATIMEILRRADSPYVGVNLDISNFEVKDDEEQYSDIAACIPRATHVHVRDLFTETERPIDLDRVWKMFAAAGHKGYMSLEYEGKEDPVTGVPKLIERIKGLCKKYSSV